MIKYKERVNYITVLISSPKAALASNDDDDNDDAWSRLSITMLYLQQNH